RALASRRTRTRSASTRKSSSPPRRSPMTRTTPRSWTPSACGSGCSTRPSHGCRSRSCPIWHRRRRVADAPANNAPIGIFDSGVGGLTVARAIMDMLPHEAVHYVGDTKYGPYGPLPLAEIRQHAMDIMDALVEDGVKLLVIACNTASSAVLRDARERFSRERGVPVVEVIVPAVRRAAALSR